jgi:hypothetical protein
LFSELVKKQLEISLWGQNHRVFLCIYVIDTVQQGPGGAPADCLSTLHSYSDASCANLPLALLGAPVNIEETRVTVRWSLGWQGQKLEPQARPKRCSHQQSPINTPSLTFSSFGELLVLRCQVSFPPSAALVSFPPCAATAASHTSTRESQGVSRRERTHRQSDFF